MPQHGAQAPLARYTVLDFTIARPGHTAVRLLADWGANVIRIEARPQDNERSLSGRRHGNDEQNLHRNRRSLCVDLKSARGHELLDRLLRRADVAVENFRADARPDFATATQRNGNRQALETAINAVTQHFSTDELVRRLNPLGVPCDPIYNVDQAFEDPQAQHLRMTRAAAHPTLGSVNLLRSPINLSSCPHPEQFSRAAPDPGQHSAELLREAGFDDESIASLIQEGVVA